MSYTMTFDASHKVGRGGHAQRFFRHIAREADQEAGFHFVQTNKNIVPERTRNNRTLINDGAGDFRQLVSVDGRPPSAEFQTYLERRLATVKRPLRKDAVLVRGLILQLDPKWFDEFNPDWRTHGPNKDAVDYMGASFDWATKEFGQANVLGFSLHLDEYNPQLQVLITPVTPDGRLSQKDYFKGPGDLRRQHKDLREHMAAAGYDVEDRVTERSREHLSSSEFQAKADRLRGATADAEAERAAYETLQQSLGNRAKNLDQREATLRSREESLAAAQQKALKAREIADEMGREAAAAQAAARRAREEAETEREQLRGFNEKLDRLPPYIERWLDKRQSNGKPLREVYEADVAREHEARVEAQRLVEGSTPRVRRSDREASW
ncbi:plasmid recombination protein [Curtobacterium sp. BRD11]|uniref:plasmid recombination protein n=1 Tax=Curtobacterium sp. BRD11 TaxID=2962581 RepID=UPI00288244DE|nr:plasmid recombination protein [Curtobacterium sp. BRD11]MDT0209016.1 plasmid recombination protein [Curtobacterium sp. BRD11]